MSWGALLCACHRFVTSGRVPAAATRRAELAVKGSSQRTTDVEASMTKLATLSGLFLLGLTSAAFAGQSGVKQDTAEIRSDRREVRQDRREVRHDNREIRADRREVRSDLRAGDRHEARQDARELRADRRDRRGDVRDLRQDRRDLRRDRRNK
jgi:hypothetical protein